MLGTPHSMRFDDASWHTHSRNVWRQMGHHRSSCAHNGPISHSFSWDHRSSCPEKASLSDMHLASEMYPRAKMGKILHPTVVTHGRPRTDDNMISQFAFS